jgi:TRAP-type C4-dicarboxylate transport system substrate-binding protein
MKWIGFAAMWFAMNATAAPLKIATLAPEGSSWMREMRAAGTAIAAKTDGRVELKFFPGGVMGSGETVLRKIKLGQLNGGAFATTELASVNPDVQAYGIPFVFDSLAEVSQARARIDPLIKKGFEQKGMTIAGLTGGGFIYLMSTKPIDTQAQLRATKVWVPEGDTIGRIAWEEAGVSPVQLALADIYTSLQTGLIETVGNTTTGAVAFQWTTKVKYMVDLPVAYTIGVLALDNKALARLSDIDRTTVVAEIGAAFAKLESINAEDDAKTRATLAKEGIQIVAPSADEAAAWREIGAKTRARLRAEGIVSGEVLDALEAVAQ